MQIVGVLTTVLVIFLILVVINKIAYMPEKNGFIRTKSQKAYINMRIMGCAIPGTILVMVFSLGMYHAHNKDIFNIYPEKREINSPEIIRCTNCLEIKPIEELEAPGNYGWCDNCLIIKYENYELPIPDSE